MKSQTTYNTERLKDILEALPETQVRQLYAGLNLGEPPSLRPNVVPNLIAKAEGAGKLPQLVKSAKLLVKTVDWSQVEVRPPKKSWDVGVWLGIAGVAAAILVAVFPRQFGALGEWLVPAPTNTVSPPTATPLPLPTMAVPTVIVVMPTSPPQPTVTPAPSATPVPSPTATPLPIQLSEDCKTKSLIVVARFKNDDKNVAADTIYQDLRKVKPDDVCVEQYDQVLTDKTAKPFGQTVSATLVIWGIYNEAYVQPYLERMQTQRTTFKPEGARLSLAVPQTVTFEVLTQELPQQARYLSFFGLGLSSFENANYTVTTQYLSQAIVATNNLLGVDSVAFCYFFRAYSWGESKNYEQALKDYDKAIELDPKGATAYLGRGIAHTNKPNLNYEQALKDYDKAIELDPKYATAYLGRGNAHTKKPNPDYTQALKDYDKAIELDPKYVAAYVNRGSAYANKPNPDYTQALKDYDKAIELDPKGAYPYGGRGAVFALQGKTKDAKGDLQQCIKLAQNAALKSFCESELGKLK